MMGFVPSLSAVFLVNAVLSQLAIGRFIRFPSKAIFRFAKEEGRFILRALTGKKFNIFLFSPKIVEWCRLSSYNAESQYSRRLPGAVNGEKVFPHE